MILLFLLYCIYHFILFFFFFFFNDTATTEIYTLSLHDALPILWYQHTRYTDESPLSSAPKQSFYVANGLLSARRSEEHTSELQSQSNLVCRLLLEKKKKKNTIY